MKKLSIFLYALLSVFIFCGNAMSTSINIDFGINGELGTEPIVPSNSFGGAVGQSGVWNEVGHETTNNLLDINSTIANISVVVNAELDNGYAGGIPITDTEKLLWDNFFSFYYKPWSVEMSGITNGLYNIYLYAPMNNSVETGSMLVNGNFIANLSGSDAGALIKGTSWDMTRVIVSNGILTISGNADGQKLFAGLSGLQLVPVPRPNVSWLFLILD